jgi:hypothetical protein
MVYFIRDSGTGHIKIGHTTLAVNQRLEQLQVGCSSELILEGWHEGDCQDEKLLHRLFASFHVRGEWFASSQELLTYIADNRIGKESREFTRLVEIEPRLGDLLRVARNGRGKRDARFCANELWCKPGGLKNRMHELVGWTAEKKELQTSRAYEVAYRVVYGAIPACDGCGCMVIVLSHRGNVVAI